MWGEDVAKLVECQVWPTADAGFTSQCGNGFFSQSQLSEQTGSRLTVFVQPPCEQSQHVCTLKSQAAVAMPLS